MAAIRVVGNQVNNDDQLSQIPIPILLRPQPTHLQLCKSNKVNVLLVASYSMFYIFDNLKKNPLAVR